MASKTIEQLDAITSVENDDLLLGLDVSDTTDSAEGTNKKFTFSSLVSSVLAKFVADETVTYDGWTPIADTLTYASSTTVTISGDHTGKFAVGDKIKLTQQTTVKYFYVTDVSYSAPNTTLTLYAGTDYTVANAAITSPYYSKMQSPVGFPDWFAYTPTLTNITVGNGILEARFRLDLLTVDVAFFFKMGSTSSVSGAIKIGVPMTIKNSTNNYLFMGVSYAHDADNAANRNVGQTAGIKNSTDFYPINSTYTVWNATSPFTWTTNDWMQCRFSYETQP